MKVSRANVPDAGTVYDALGNRVATKINGVWQYVVYDAFGKCVAEYGQLADGVGGVKYVQQDWQGSVRTVTNANGFVVARTDHQAFGGNVGSGTGQRAIEQGYNTDAATRQGYGLTERDEASGQDHTWFRKNENSAGRWTSPDPYNGSMNLGDPQSFNRFSYVTNDPVNFVDPSGLIIKIPDIGGFNVEIQISWFDKMWEDHWGADNGGDFGWLSDGFGPSINSGDGGGRGPSHSPAIPEDCPPVPPYPANADLDGNIALAKKNGLGSWWNPARPAQDASALLWFRAQVKNKAPWDYKQMGSQYQDFGNFNYGATGLALGLDEMFLLKEAGRAQQVAGTSKKEWNGPGSRLNPLGGQPPYGDDPDDQAQIKKGFEYYRAKERGCTWKK